MAELENPRYEKFAQGLASGLSQRVAFRAAFPKSAKWKDETVDVKACQLAKDGKIQIRLKELAAESSSAAVMTAKERKEWLTKIIQTPYEETKDRLKALDLLNKMDGAYTENVNVSGNVNNPFSGLSTEELKKLIDNG